MKNKRTPSLGFSLILMAILLVPYTSRLFHIEPFPAVIMPSGHGRLDVSKNQVENLEYELSLYQNDRTHTDISMKHLFPLIPEQYYIPIIHSNLGFSMKEGQIPLFRNFNYRITKDQNSPKETGELKEYYSNVLPSQADSLILKVYTVARSIDSREVTQKELIDRNSFSLK